MTGKKEYPRLVTSPLGILVPVRTREEHRRHLKFNMIVAVIFTVLMIGAVIAASVLVWKIAILHAAGVLS